MNNYELKHYLSSYDVQVVCSDDLPAVAKKAPILDREYRRMRGKRFTLGRFSFSLKRIYGVL